MAVDSKLCRRVQPANQSLAKQGARQIVKVLRNAIAHNNIYAFARRQSGVISDLAFFGEVIDRNGGRDSKVIDHYEVLSMSIDDFRAFLTAWFALLRTVSRSGARLKLVVSNAMEIDDERLAAHG